MPPSLSDSATGGTTTSASASNRTVASPMDEHSRVSVDNIPTIKCVLVGDGAVGKTSLLASYSVSDCPAEYIPTTFDNYAVIVTVEGNPVRLQLCDTAGQQELTSLRTLCYNETNVFLLCFSVVNPVSYRSIVQTWLPEVRRSCPNTPIILVGTQCDLRNDATIVADLRRFGELPVSEADASLVAKRIGGTNYIECSAARGQHVKEVFDLAIFVALDDKGLVKKRRGLSSIRRSNKYTCNSAFWNSSSSAPILIPERKMKSKRPSFRWGYLCGCLSKQP